MHQHVKNSCKGQIVVAPRPDDDEDAPIQEADAENSAFESIGIDEYHIVKHHDLAMLYCTTCNVCLFPDQVLSHLGSAHKLNKRLRNVKLSIEEAVSASNANASVEALEMWLKPGNVSLPVVPGLPVHAGYKCTACLPVDIGFCSPSSKSVASHCRLLHNLIGDANKSSISKCHFQQILLSVPDECRLYFEVLLDPNAQIQATATVAHLEDWQADFETIMDETYDPMLTVADKDHWVSLLQWDDIIAPHRLEMETVFAFIGAEQQNEGWATPLAKAITNYFAMVQESMKNNTCYTFRILVMDKSVDPKNSHKPFALSPLQHEKSCQAYCRSYLSFVMMVIRRFTNDRYVKFPGVSNRITSQVRSLNSALRSGPQNDDTLIALLYAFNMAIWTDTTHTAANDDKKCPIYSYLAYYSVKKDGSFRLAHTLTQEMARLQYWARATALYEMGRLSKEIPQDCLDPNGYFASILSVVKEHQFNTFSTLRNVMHICLHVAKSTDMGPNTDWVEGTDYRAQRIDGHILYLHDLGAMYRKALLTAKALFRDITHGMPVLGVKLGDFVENYASTAIGYNFLANEANGLIGQRQSLVHWFTEGPAERKLLLFHQNGSWDPELVHAWNLKIDKLMHILFFLTQLSSGMPARMPEIETHTLVNTSSGRRSFYFTSGTICLITWYWKGRNCTTNDKPVARFLPRDLALLLLRYIVWVRPMQVFLARKLSFANLESDLKSFLWVGINGRLQADTLGNLWPRLFAEFHQDRFQINVSKYRHVTEAFVQKNVDVANAKPPVNLHISLQAGHSQGTANARYGQSSTEDMANMNQNAR